MTKLAVIDDHAMVRAGIAAVVKTNLPDVDYVAEAGSSEELVERFEDTAFELILLDYHLPNSDPSISYELLRRVFSQAKIVYLSSDENREIAIECISHGAAGFVVKSSNMELLVAIIEFVLAGGTYIPKHALEPHGGSALSSGFRTPMDDLTPRQRQVLELLLDGKPNKRIASLLNISESTVKSHLMAVFKALSVSSRVDAIRKFRS